MSRFMVKAATADGRVTSTEVEADSREEVELRLEREGLFPIEVRPRGTASVFSSLLTRRGGRVKRSEFLVFNKGLVALLKAGLPVTECLDTLSHLVRNPAFRSAVNDAAGEIRNGRTFSEGLARHPEVFPALYTASIGSGERTGDLIPAITDYVVYQHRIEGLRKKVVSSLTYPAALTGFTSLIIIFLISYVVPRFAKIYGDMGGDMPLPSRMLMALSDFVVTFAPFIVLALASAAVLARLYLKSGPGRLMLDRVKLEFPQLGEIYRSYVVAKFARTLSMILRSGVHIIQALEMSRPVLGNLVMEERLERVITRAREGGSLTSAVSETGLMPEISLRMLGVGEKSASLPAMLSDIADYHDEDVDHKARIITSLIEPALMIVMGVFIGAIVLLIYLPIFYLVGANY